MAKRLVWMATSIIPLKMTDEIVAPEDIETPAPALEVEEDDLELEVPGEIPPNETPEQKYAYDEGRPIMARAWGLKVYDGVWRRSGGALIGGLVRLAQARPF